ncbi:RrF2 family transcriptional regulator [Falsiroseomonas stagni]|uniref:Transcriptional regulator, BadM/Rrf2 family n=1 Tax=Falsiroseomonas stagni DSM 19981 TaxID=1123062 RepID=A0A1I4DPV0_9PROT|nr:Rrf2 family transcriptional regulator [Falsiroseomonas stagni]SFK94046.1 transcriptional regulator, BadM/Rrf2 family [Falsiroseomonas stagni DSM 19981]
MLTQKAKYGLKALSVLAEAGAAAPSRRATMPIHEIAERARAPRKFLEAILLDLRRHGFVDSLRGKSGGYALARPATQIALSDLIRAIDGPLAPIPCASLTAYRPCIDCVEPADCAIRRVMRQVRDATAEILDGTMLADIAAPAPRPAITALLDVVAERACQKDLIEFPSSR